jgi:hypothetical protein
MTTTTATLAAPSAGVSDVTATAAADSPPATDPDAPGLSSRAAGRD